MRTVCTCKVGPPLAARNASAASLLRRACPPFLSLRHAIAGVWESTSRSPEQDGLQPRALALHGTFTRKEFVGDSQRPAKTEVQEQARPFVRIRPSVQIVRRRAG